MFPVDLKLKVTSAYFIKQLFQVETFGLQVLRERHKSGCSPHGQCDFSHRTALDIYPWLNQNKMNKSISSKDLAAPFPRFVAVEWIREQLSEKCAERGRQYRVLHQTRNRPLENEFSRKDSKLSSFLAMLLSKGYKSGGKPLMEGCCIYYTMCAPLTGFYWSFKSALCCGNNL